MGNQISQPVITIPVDALWTDVPNLTVDKRLGSARFLKTIRATTTNTAQTKSLAVVKVFVKPHSDFSLATEINRTKDQSAPLNALQAACPYSKILETDRAVFLFRPYFHSSLYDRISTRPFLSLLERKWIAFQLILSLSQCHAVNIKHGDIKSENVMLTSCHKAFLVDFAPFKPASVPVDNPSDFVYFFDASSRRTCYLAPERFRDDQLTDLEITEPMDIFSLGCVLAELFLEGRVLFSLAQLLLYRKYEYDISAELDLIGDDAIKDMLTSMLHVNPNQRPTAESLLACSRVFPHSFAGSFVPYVDQYLDDSDSTRISNTCPGPNPWSKADLRLMKTWNALQQSDFPPELLLLTLPHVTCCIRSLTYPTTFTVAIDLLALLSKHIIDEHRLDRVVPYLCWILKTVSHSHVRAMALDCLTQILSSVTCIRSEDVGLFPEILFPLFSTIISENDTIVRAVFARSLTALSASSVQFLQHAQQMNEAQQSHGNVTLFPFQSSDVALAEVQRTFLEYLQNLISDESVLVRRAILNIVGQIAGFFGRQATVDVILSHIITYLNEKDEALRSAFFYALVGLSQTAGAQNVQEYIFPLMLQAFQDPSLVVVHDFMCALDILVGLKFLRNIQLRTTVSHVSNFVVHPNVFVRHAAMKVALSCSGVVDNTASAALFVPSLRPFLSRPIFTNFLQNGPLDFLRLLKPPTDGSPNQLKGKESGNNDLARSKSSKNGLRSSGELCYSPPTSGMRAISSIYQEDGRISIQALKLAPRTVFLSTSSTPNKQQYGILERGSVALKRVISSSNLSSVSGGKAPGTPPSQYSPYLNSPLENPVQPSSNDESTHIYVHRDHASSAWPLKAHAETSTVNATITANMSRASTSSFRGPNLPQIDDWQEDDVDDRSARLFEWKVQEGNNPFVNDLIASKARELHLPQPTSSRSSGRNQPLVFKQDPGNAGPNPNKRWVPNGDLLATLTEHTAGVNMVRTMMDGTILVSGAADGNIKVWDPSRILKNRGTQSRATYQIGGDVRGLVVLSDKPNVIVAGSDSGKVQLLQIQPKKGIVRVVEEHQLPAGQAVTAMAHVCSETESVVLVASSASIIHGLGVDGTGWMFTIPCPPAYGPITTILNDERNNAWMLVGTLSGTLVLFDLRFRILVRAWVHPARTRIHRISTYWPAPDHVVVAAGKGMVSVWKVCGDIKCEYVFTRFPVESHQMRTQAKLIHGDDFVQNSTKVFEGKQASEGIYSACTPRYGDFVIFAGADRSNVRMWCAESGQAAVVLGNVPDPHSPEITHVLQDCDGAHVLAEIQRPRVAASKERKTSTDVGFSPTERRSQAIEHMDAITDVLVLDHYQPALIATASRDGTVKIWR